MRKNFRPPIPQGGKVIRPGEDDQVNLAAARAFVDKVAKDLGEARTLLALVDPAEAADDLTLAMRAYERGLLVALNRANPLLFHAIVKAAPAMLKQHEGALERLASALGLEHQEAAVEDAKDGAYSPPLDGSGDVDEVQVKLLDHRGRATSDHSDAT